MTEETNDFTLILARLSDPDPTLQKNALNVLLDELRTKTPLKIAYLDEHVPTLENTIPKLTNENQKTLFDILSALLVYKDSAKAIHYRVLGNTTPLDYYGHHYVKQLLSGVVKDKRNCEQTGHLATECITFLFQHNLECDAIDFIDEMSTFNNNGVNILSNDNNQSQKFLSQFVDEHNYDRVTHYLKGMSHYNPEYKKVLQEIHLKMKNYSALFVCLLNEKNYEEINKLFLKVNPITRKQLILMAARTGMQYSTKDEEENRILKNQHILKFFKNLIIDLQIEKPREVCDFLKGGSALRYDREISVKIISPVCLANSFVHLGFGRDTIFCSTSEDLKIEIDLKPLDSAAMNEQISIFGSIGAINCFSPSECFDALSDLISGENIYRRTGALLGLSISNSKSMSDDESVTTLLLENLQHECPYLKIATLLGLQLIYVGTSSPLILCSVQHHLNSEHREVCDFSSFVIGSVYAGSGDLNVATLLLDCICSGNSTGMTSSRYGISSSGCGSSGVNNGSELNNSANNNRKRNTSVMPLDNQSSINPQSNNQPSTMPNAQSVIHPITPLFTILGLGLIFYKKQNYANILSTLSAMGCPFHKHVSILVRAFAHCGSGDTELINEIFSEAFEDENNYNKPLLQSIAMLSMCLISLGDELCEKCTLRIVTSATIVDNTSLKCVVPLCMALLSASNPAVELIDTISKFCNSSDHRIVINAFVALGILGAGTNNAHISNILESLLPRYSDYSKIDQAIRVAQGLLHLGKGTATLSPFLFRREFLDIRKLIGLFCPILGLVDSESNSLFARFNFLNFLFVQSASLKYCVTVDFNLNPISTILSIGEPVNVVGIVGRPRKITGVQTHTSPVIVQESEVVEISEEAGVGAVSCFVEDIVIVE